MMTCAVLIALLLGFAVIAYLARRPGVIVYGDSFADDSPRERQRKAKVLVAKALGSVDAPARKARSVSRKARKK